MEKHPFTFEGRIRRTTFWFRTFLVLFAIYITVVIAIYLEEPMVLIANANIALLLSVFWGMQAVKRVHDVDKTWWYAFVPFYNFFLFGQEGQYGDNSYGQDPKGPKIRIRVQSRKPVQVRRSLQVNPSKTTTQVQEVGVRPQINIKKR